MSASKNNSVAAALVKFGGYGGNMLISGAPHVFRRRQQEHVSGWRGGGIRRLRGLAFFLLYYCYPNLYVLVGCSMFSMRMLS